VRPDAGWLGPQYKSANRLACLYFLREIGMVDAFLANVYFTGDPHPPQPGRSGKKASGRGRRAWNIQSGAV